MRIYLDDDDCPDAGDRETAARIIQEIALNDVVTRGSFVLEGYSADRRIARALTAARADERRRGFETPMPMRRLVPAPWCSGRHGEMAWSPTALSLADDRRGAVSELSDRLASHTAYLG